MRELMILIQSEFFLLVIMSIQLIDFNRFNNFHFFHFIEYFFQRISFFLLIFLFILKEGVPIIHPFN